MNWYVKILFASHNMRFSKETETDIDEITNFIVDYRSKNKTNNDIIGPLTMENPYTETKLEIDIYVLPLNNAKPNVAAEYDPNNNRLWIYVYNVKTNEKDQYKLFNIYRPFISHELVHAIDPKFAEDVYVRPKDNDDPLLLPTEFDGYSKQISEILKKSITPQNEEQIKNWIRTQNLDALPTELSSFKNLLFLWKEESPIYIRRLFTRLYNECFGDK